MSVNISVRFNNKKTNFIFPDSSVLMELRRMHPYYPPNETWSAEDVMTAALAVQRPLEILRGELVEWCASVSE